MIPESSFLKKIGKTAGTKILEKVSMVIVKKGSPRVARSIPRTVVLLREELNRLKKVGLVKSGPVRLKNGRSKVTNFIPGEYRAVAEDVLKNGERSISAIEELEKAGIPLDAIEKDVEKGLTAEAIKKEVDELVEKGISKETIAKETRRGLAVSEIKRNVEHLLDLGISPGSIERDVARGVSTSEMVENVNYLLDRGMSRETSAGSSRRR